MRPIRFPVLPLVMLPLIAAVAVRPVQAQPEQPSGIRVSGQGRITAQPDVAILNLGASLRRETPGAAFDRAEQLIAAATTSLRTNGVAEADITTADLSLFPEYRYLPPSPENPSPEPVLLGWRARHFLSVKLRDFSRLGRAVDDAVRALEDAAELQGIFFTIENTDPLLDRARDAAATDARQKAERIATRLGVRVGTPIFVQEFFSPPPSPIPFAPFPSPTPLPRPVATPAAMRALPAQITPGEQVISVTIDVLFDIEEAPPS